MFARLHFRFDQRTPEVVEVVQRHWFWGAIAERLRVYKDILGAAALVNIFVLAGGLLLVFGVDYAIRLLRGHFVDLAISRIDLKLSALIMERVLGMRLANRPASVGSFAANLRSFETVRDFIASATVTAVIDLPFMLFLAVIIWISWPLIVFPVLGIIGVLIYSYRQRFLGLAGVGRRCARPARSAQGQADHRLTPGNA